MFTLFSNIIKYFSQKVKAKTIPVAAAVIEINGKILIARRNNSLCGNPGWEFPGGKVELNETFQQCLAREIKEEFNVEIKVGDFIAESIHKTKNKIIRLHAFKAVILSGIITPAEHEEIAFVKPEELLNYNLLPADIPIAKKIIKNYQVKKKLKTLNSQSE